MDAKLQVYKINNKDDATMNDIRCQVAKGYPQLEWADFPYTFSPVTRLVTVKLLPFLVAVEYNMHNS